MHAVAPVAAAPLDRALLDVLVNAGVRDAHLQQELGRRPGPGRRALWATATDLLGQGVGVDVGTRLADPAWVGPAGYAVRASATLADGLARLQSVCPFILGRAQLAVRRDGDQVVLALNPAGRPWPGAAAEALVLATLGAGHLMTGVQFPATLSFQHWPSTGSRQRLASIAGDVRAGAAGNAVTFAASWLELPFVHADPGLVRCFEQLLPQVPAPAPTLLEAARAAARTNLARGVTDADSLARALGMSARHLQRRLAAHGARLGATIEHARIALARELLDDPRHALAEIAERAGYADERALRRAFVRVVGVTPSAYRRARR